MSTFNCRYFWQCRCCKAQGEFEVHEEPDEFYLFMAATVEHEFRAPECKDDSDMTILPIEAQVDRRAA